MQPITYYNIHHIIARARVTHTAPRDALQTPPRKKSQPISATKRKYLLEVYLGMQQDRPKEEGKKFTQEKSHSSYLMALCLSILSKDRLV